MTMSAHVDVLACEWPHHHPNWCNQCRGAGTLPVGMELRFVLRGQDTTWRRRLDMETGDVDCTDLPDDEFIAALLRAGCKVYTDEYLARVQGGAA